MSPDPTPDDSIAAWLRDNEAETADWLARVESRITPEPAANPCALCDQPAVVLLYNGGRYSRRWLDLPSGPVWICGPHSVGRY